MELTETELTFCRENKTLLFQHKMKRKKYTHALIFSTLLQAHMHTEILICIPRYIAFQLKSVRRLLAPWKQALIFLLLQSRCYQAFFSKTNLSCYIEHLFWQLPTLLNSPNSLTNSSAVVVSALTASPVTFKLHKFAQFPKWLNWPWLTTELLCFTLLFTKECIDFSPSLGLSYG
jgi:hypothetical protein